MPVKYSRESTNEEYIKCLKELGIINNTTNDKKDIKRNFKGRQYEFNKYLMIS